MNMPRRAVKYASSAGFYKKKNISSLAPKGFYTLDII